ncbi:chemotaxis protein CheW [Aliiglaciecola sp. CAU 1673]|uniref:chemotaxis protein CheW n=1 Tax=Aliiglaciecola sp. CAU 1673 TaxID=3032595 RepID=UPI0023DA49FC|nr:chemotaxis protein CheW [Aliiglaciecola sp. CAU 1673]MDF2176987.1 chemotaxis protein CheW [Aliiglaciecola sp. CAU 1673]
MTKILDSVDQRTKLVGENRLELLMFRLNSRQIFAINVFKVKEVITRPPMNKMPGSHPSLCGIINYRGKSVPVIDMRAAIRMPAKAEDPAGGNVIITEYNRTVQGFLIGSVINIVNTSWSDIMPPPSTAGRKHFLTAITHYEHEGRQEIVEIVDVEKVLADIISYDVEISEEVLEDEVTPLLRGKKVLIVDDSSTARNQIRETLQQVGLQVIERQDGLQALKLLQSWADEGKTVTDEILMMFTDAEMPEMDGYRLTAEVRNDPRMSNLFICLNTSLSGSFNQAMVEKVGCDRFISKFQPDLLVQTAQERMRQLIKLD